MTRLIALLVLCLSVPAQAADSFTFSHPPGPHAVGLKVVQQYDRTRLYKAKIDLTTGEPTSGERARPIQTLIWYPATKGGKPVTFTNYMETILTEDDFSRSAGDVKQMVEARLQRNGSGRREALLHDVTRPMLAVRDAAAHTGKFPVVIYAPSFSASAMENTDLCELLASQGYVVLSSASLGARTRSMTTDLEGAETQAADIAYLIGYAGTLPQADTSNVAVVGFSWGGLANVLAAAKDQRIRALVSLDGSIRSTRNLVDGGKDAAKYVTPASVAIPMLYIGRRPMTFEELNTAEVDSRYSFMNTMKYSNVYSLTLLPMKHMDFSSYHLRMAPVGDFGDYERDEIALAHSWAARYVVHFINGHLKNDAAGLAFINNTPAANKAPLHMIIADTRRNRGGPPPTLENFVAQLAVDGFDKAIPVYDSLVKQGASFKLGENEIYGWGNQLVRLNRPLQAREIFRLGAHLYPNESVMHEETAELQAKTGQKEEALRSYRRVLEIDPTNVDAAKYLKEHSGA
jgi:dienelactone hydrolase